MRFFETLLSGLWLIEHIKTSADFWRGMIRGLHFQADPKPEVKLIRCTTGAIWDLIVDVHRRSPTFGRWESFELSGQNRRCLLWLG